MRRVAKLLVVIGLALAVFSTGSLGLGKAIHRQAPSPLPDITQTLAAARVVGGGSLGKIISSLQDRVRAVPEDWRAQAGLGLAYVQNARITGDPSYYPKADGILRRSLQLHPAENFEALTGMAALTAARHDFSASLSWGERALAMNPQNANAHAIVGDALVELGRYPRAFDAFQRAVDLRPDLVTYARASYAWELQGSPENAARIMELALQAAGTPADTAWATHQLGELAWSRGRLREARAYFGQAARMDPSFFPARAGQAKVAAAQGRTEEAIHGYQAIVDVYPVPEYVIALGDLLQSAGREREAHRQYELVDVETKLLRGNGVNVDLEIALFDADQARPAEALAAAEAEWARRQGIHVADALAWALHANGRDEAALGFANRALELGTRNPLFLFHRGMIEHALGRDGAARRDVALALQINPWFSIRWSGPAADLLESLGGAP